MKKPQILKFDKLVEFITALGVPGLILVGVIGGTGLVGAAATTAGLAAIGPGGMVAGVITLVAAGVIAEGLSKFTFESIFSAVLKNLYLKGETKESLFAQIDKYKISDDLKRKLIDDIEKMSRN